MTSAWADLFDQLIILYGIKAFFVSKEISSVKGVQIYVEVYKFSWAICEFEVTISWFRLEYITV